MTKREKVLATTLLATMAVLGGGVFFHMFVYEPIVEIRAERDVELDELKKEQDELTKEETRIKNILRVNPRLTQWKELSLPPKDPKSKPQPGISLEEQKTTRFRELQVAYDKYLDTVLRKSGFQGDSISITPRSANRRTSSSLQSKEALFEPLVFGVQARGSYQSMVDMLKKFHSTPLLHQIRTFTVALSQNRSATQEKGLLDVTMTVEALVVTGGQEREIRPEPNGLLPKLPYQPRVLAEPGRSYDQMVKRNMFTGVAPVAKTLAASKSTEPKSETLRFVKLTMLFFNPDRRRWEATLYDQAKGTKETKLNERILNEFTVADSAGIEVLKAKVVKIDEEQMIFESEGRFYRMRCGDFIYPAIREPVPEKELKSLGIVMEISKSSKDGATPE